MAIELFEIKSGNEGFGYLIEKDAGFISLDDPHNKDIVAEINGIGNGNDVKVVDRMKVIAVLQKYGIENANGRIYPESILKKQVSIYQDKINDRRSYGETNHPESVSLDLDRLSFGITKLWWEDKTLLGELELILSPGYIKYGVISCKGDLIANYIRTGWKIGISSRGLGSVEKDRFSGKYTVQDDFEITCWDFVSDPSTKNAWLSTNYDDLKPYVESKETTKRSIIEGLDNFLNKKNLI